MFLTSPFITQVTPENDTPGFVTCAVAMFRQLRGAESQRKGSRCFTSSHVPTGERSTSADTSGSAYDKLLAVRWKGDKLFA